LVWHLIENPLLTLTPQGMATRGSNLLSSQKKNVIPGLTGGAYLPSMGMKVGQSGIKGNNWDLVGDDRVSRGFHP
jgi:hypothetical protein